MEPGKNAATLARPAVAASCPGILMPISPVPASTNQLIDRLPAADARSLLARCRPADLEFGTELNSAGAPISRVHFPTTAVISLTAAIGGHHPLEIGVIGFEGMLGASMALGVDRHPLRAIVPGAGQAHEISAADFRGLLQDSKRLEQTLHGYLFVLAEQLAHSAACNAFHAVEARLARWLLIMDDRTRGEPLVLTHLFLADMLGVRRSAVTIAAGRMQDREMIRYRRGHIRVLSRPGLESIACECYPAALAAYRRQFN
jgi:CRP-like cAMP-binding protein